MRGWFPLFAALALLAVVPPSQAALADATLDPCVNLHSVFEDPTAVVVFADQCTVRTSMDVERTDAGITVTTVHQADDLVITTIIEYVDQDVIITIAVAYAEYGESFVFDCTDPDHWPQYGDHLVWDERCRVPTEWMQ